MQSFQLDRIDERLIAALASLPRAGMLQLARAVGVARNTAQARFDRLSTGLEFHDYPEGPADLKHFAGWDLATTCGTGSGTSFRDNALAVRLGGGAGAI